MLKLLATLMVWRLLLSAGVSLLLALALSQAFATFTAGYCIALVLLGTGFGVLWHSRAEAGVGLLAAVTPTPVSKPVAFLGFLLIGCIYGGLASVFMGSSILGAVALVSSVAVVGLWRHLALHREVSLGYLAFACGSLLSGLAISLFIEALNTQAF